MSLLDTASLIVTPNGYKEGKLYSVIPSDGSGDLSVTRATTATRVNSSGLVELVPYNLIWYSEQFDNVSYWGLEQISVTANSTTAPNGTTTADTITDSSTFGYTYQSVPISGGVGSIVTHSVFLKRTNNDWVNVAASRTPGTTYGEFGVWFNLATGAIGSNFQAGVGVVVDSEITDEGNGWYRCSVTGYVPNAVGYVPYVFNSNADNSFTSSAGKSRYQWGAQLVEGSVAKDYQKTETRLNIPRLDYSNGTCPSILVEPQRTNICRDSNNLSGSSWINQSGNTTLTRIQTGGVDGGAFDRLVVGGAVGSDQGRFVQFTTNVGANAIYSVYLKGSGQAFIGLYNGVSATPTIVTLTSEWTRYEVLSTGGSGTYIDWALFLIGGSTIDVAFHQVEYATYATSYIPTTSASVTRNADVISKTGISSLIGQTEGTLFWEGQGNIQATGFDLWLFAASANDTTTAFLLYYVHSSGYINCYINNGSSFVNLGTPMDITINNKIAVGYKSGDFVMYINGVQVDSNTSATAIPSGMNQVAINKWAGFTGEQKQSTKAAALWKTRLTNTQLAQLTTI